MFCVSPLLHPEELISCCHCSSTFFPVVVSAFAVVCSLNLCVLPFSPALSCQHCSSAQLPHGSCLPSHPAPGFAALLYPLDFMGLIHCSSLAFEEGDLPFYPKDFSLKEKLPSHLSCDLPQGCQGHRNWECTWFFISMNICRILKVKLMALPSSRFCRNSIPAWNFFLFNFAAFGAV